MPSEIRMCQNCKINFRIEPEDFAFYEKMKVPAPTWCPQCRLIRRLAFDNKRTIYSSKCIRCSKPQISELHPLSPLKAYCSDCWWGDSWDGLDYGRGVDFTRPFLFQMKELMADVPWMARAADEPTLENSDYCANVGHLKNCYLLFHADFDENCAYCDMANNSKDCFDCNMLDECELCFECINIQKCYKAFHCVDCENSNEIMFCRDISGCSNCFGCVGLRNKEYCFFNEQLTKNEYEQHLADFQQGSYQTCQTMIDRSQAFWLQFPRKYIHGRQNEGVSGDYIGYSKNTYHSFEVSQCEDSKYIVFVGLAPTKDSYDYTVWGDGASRIYECIAVGLGTDMTKFSFQSWPCSEVEYSIHTLNSSSCFGCIGIRKKQYCILNKQYTKEEYEALVPKIRQHMNDMPYVDAMGRVYQYGEFFPMELSAYAYNESRAYEYFFLSKEAALAQGYAWRDPEDRNVAPTLLTNELPDHIRDVSDSTIKEIIACEHAGICSDRCTVVFKVIMQELAFHKKMNLPLPRLCPNCRYAERIKFRNPMKLWDRQCQCGGAKSQNGVYTNTTPHTHGASPCPTTFQTAHSPDQPGIIYCAECYQREIM